MLNNDDMNPYAAGMSIFVSMLSALTIIGWPTEVFLYGDAIVWRLAGGLLAAWMGTSVFVPFFHRLRLFSIYDYFKLRFNSPFMMNVTLAIGLIARVHKTWNDTVVVGSKFCKSFQALIHS